MSADGRKSCPDRGIARRDGGDRRNNMNRIEGAKMDNIELILVALKPSL